MTTLLFLIYFAEISGKLAAVFGIVGWVGIFGVILTWVTISVNYEKLLPFKFLPASIFAGLIILSCILPSKETIYTITALKIGGDVATEFSNSKYAQQIKTILDHELDEIVKSYDKNKEAK